MVADYIVVVTSLEYVYEGKTRWPRAGTTAAFFAFQVPRARQLVYTGVLWCHTFKDAILPYNQGLICQDVHVVQGIGVLVAFLVETVSGAGSPASPWEIDVAVTPAISFFVILIDRCI